jgi:hypothetical protein
MQDPLDRKSKLSRDSMHTRNASKHVVKENEIIKYCPSNRAFGHVRVRDLQR